MKLQTATLSFKNRIPSPLTLAPGETYVFKEQNLMGFGQLNYEVVSGSASLIGVGMLNGAYEIGGNFTAFPNTITKTVNTGTGTLNDYFYKLISITNLSDSTPCVVKEISVKVSVPFVVGPIVQDTNILTPFCSTIDVVYTGISPNITSVILKGTLWDIDNPRSEDEKWIGWGSKWINNLTPGSGINPLIVNNPYKYIFAVVNLPALTVNNLKTACVQLRILQQGSGY